MKTQAIQPRMRFVSTATGAALIGGKVYTYAAGTTTPQTTWTDSTGNTANANPVILDERGEADIWIGELLYKFVTTDANDVEIDTTDNISGALLYSASTGSASIGFIQSGTGAVAQTAQNYMRKAVYSDDYSTMQEAVDAASGRVLVLRGTNSVTSTLNLPVKFRMVQEPNASIDLDVADVGILIANNSTDVTLEGIVITGTCGRAIAGAGVHTNVKIRGCDISGYTLPVTFNAGIFFSDLTDSVIEQNYMHGGGAGVFSSSNADICLWTTATGNVDVRIIENKLTSTGVGAHVYCYDTINALVRGNRMEGARLHGAGNNNGYGCAFYFVSVGKENKFLYNTVRDTQGTGLYVASNNDMVIHGNRFEDVAQTQSDASLPVGAIALNGVTSASVVGGTINDSGKDGIVIANCVGVAVSAIKDIRGVTQYGVNLRGTGNDISVSSCSALSTGSHSVNSDATAKTKISIVDFTSTSSGGRGINLTDVSESTVSSCHVNGAQTYGIYVNGAASKANSIIGNTVENCGLLAANTYDGIACQVDRTTVTANTSSGANHRYGIYSDGDSCIVIGNIVPGNTTAGVDVSGANSVAANNVVL